MMFPFRVKEALVAPFANISNPALAFELTVVKAKFLSEVSSADPVHRTLPEPVVPDGLIVIVLLVPIELLAPARPSLLTYKVPELPRLIPPPKELLVPVR